MKLTKKDLKIRENVENMRQIVIQSQEYKEGKITFKDIMDKSIELDKQNKYEMVCLLWKLCSLLKHKKFKEEFIENCNTQFAEKYGRWLIN